MKHLDRKILLYVRQPVVKILEIVASFRYKNEIVGNNFTFLLLSTRTPYFSSNDVQI